MWGVLHVHWAVPGALTDTQFSGEWPSHNSLHPVLLSLGAVLPREASPAQPCCPPSSCAGG